jgi:hypothetical protein
MRIPLFHNIDGHKTFEQAVSYIGASSERATAFPEINVISYLCYLAPFCPYQVMKMRMRSTDILSTFLRNILRFAETLIIEQDS